MEKIVRLLLLVACLQATMMVVSADRPDFITDEIMEMLQGDKQRCMAAHGTTEALIAEVNEGKLENNRAITCYMHCLFEAFSLIDEDNELEVEMLVGFLPESMQADAEHLIDLCAKQSADDGCDKMYLMAKCVQEKRPDLWFMV